MCTWTVEMAEQSLGNFVDKISNLTDVQVLNKRTQLDSRLYPRYSMLLILDWESVIAPEIGNLICLHY